jgi:hypothetical protein
MANLNGPVKSYQIPTGEEGVHSQGMLVEFANNVAPSSQVITFYRGSGTNTTGSIYLSGIDYVNTIISVPVVGDTATTTVSAVAVMQKINGPTTLAIIKTEAAAIIYDFVIYGISYGN